MKKVFCRIGDRLADPLFEVFDGGDFVLSSYRGIEDSDTEMRIYTADDAGAAAAESALRTALDAIDAGETAIAVEDVPDEDWKFSYRRHFTAEKIGRRLATVPLWERGTEAVSAIVADRQPIYIDPGLAFGTGRHETTRACLEFIDAGAESRERVAQKSFLDMGCGSGILSIAAAKLGYSPVRGFDIDEIAVEAAKENAVVNGADVEYRLFALGGGGIGLDESIEAAKGVYPDLAAKAPAVSDPPFPPADFVVANILGPLLIAFADEIVSFVKETLVISGILTVNYPETLAAFTSRGFTEIERKDLGEWTSALLRRA